jgi:hypothetical protein
VRDEQAVFDELAVLCAAPGYAHAIAHFCFRDNLVRFDAELTAEDMAHLHSPSRLIRSEISTLIGLLVRQPVDYTLPALDTLQVYIDQTEGLLQELHKCMSAMFFKDITPNGLTADGRDPGSRGEVMREPIFYGGDSAYSFQYRELAPLKYAEDDEWLEANKGFSMRVARDVVHALGALQCEKQMATLQSLRFARPEDWTLLPAFTFTVRELAEWSGISLNLVKRVLAAFSLPIGNYQVDVANRRCYSGKCVTGRQLTSPSIFPLRPAARRENHVRGTQSQFNRRDRCHARDDRGGA